jgi:hypothetical protein
MLLKFCLALLVTLSSATLNQHQYRHPWDMENDHQDPPSVIYVLPDSEFKKYQTKNVNQICTNIFLGDYKKFFYFNWRNLVANSCPRRKSK